jgi:FkbM family methyltransferase
MNNSVSDQKLNELLNQFALSPEDSENNFNLGFYYESIGQTASAISYYLRSAERTKNLLEQYECLVRASMCFDDQGTRNFTVKGLLQHAISICPKRPEAYYLLSRFYENENKDGKWNYSFLIASIGEKVADFNSSSLRTEVDYPGKYAILYQKALAAWWCGLCDESRNIFNDLIQNYDLNEDHKNKVLENLKRFNETNKNLHQIYYKNKEEFDWGIFKNDSFMYECFKRDIIDQRQYEKFFEVEEGDIVLDVGASIGPFTYSILEKNPELVICLEPHKKLFQTLKSNFSKNKNVICLNKGISTIDGEVIFHTLYDDTADQTSWEKNDSGYGISLKNLVKEYNLEKIDFLKIDCEGGEYDFFTEENFDWIVNNIKKISGEFHFYRDHTRERFVWFRDNYLTKFKNFSIFFVDNDGNFNDITDKVWDNDFFNTYGWVNIYIDNRNTGGNKLDGFPSVHFCTLEESKDRRNNLLKQFAEYNIRPKAHFFERNRENTHYGLTLSHLTMFYDWYHTTDEPYAIFCEDDVSLETVPYWNFTWKEFMNSLPEHWECIQLSLLCEVDSELSEVRLKPRLFQHWGTQIFLITREYAKKVLDRQHYNRQEMTYDFVVHGKPFLEPHVENLLFDSGTGGFIYNCPLFVESIYQFESTFDKSERPEHYCGKNSYDLITKWWKEKGPTTKLSDIMKKPYKVVDFCSFYGPYGSEMLLLRYHTLKGYVDEFVVSESSYSHTGIPVKFECKNKIKEWGLPEEKFKVIELQTPPDEELVIEQIDEMNCYDALSGNVQENIKSKYARVRDRLSKDALLQVLDDYDDNTVFIHGDIDEIINPSYIPNVADIFIKNFPHCFFYIPLIYLEGRADLRVYNKDWNCPESWDWAMFMCNKSLLKTVTPVQIRSNKLIPEGVGTFHLNNSCTGERWTDVGWHFSWMGGKESRLIKKQSWEHRYDSFDWLVTKKYDDSDEFLSQEYKEGDTPPCGKVNLVLKDFSKENLPEEIFELPVVENFLFPTNKKKRIVDFFPYFDATGRELLEFRIKLLNDYVDEFVICESNKTLSGIPIEFNLKEVIEELNLPKEKIRIIQLEIPEDDQLQIEEIDRINVCSYNSNNLDNLNSLRARVRERLQQNSLLKVLDYYDEDTIFIVGHQDEIIIPEALSWIPNLVRQFEDTQIIRIPLIYLEGRADLMVVNKNDAIPLPWVTLFLATKKQLKNITPCHVRSNVLGNYQAVSPSEGGKIIPELGWHFTWMGDFDRKITKCKSWTHYDDYNYKGFSGGTEKIWEVEQLKSRLSKFNIKEGDISPIWGNENLIYKKYPTEKLPKLIFEMPHIQEFLLPTEDFKTNKLTEEEERMFKISKISEKVSQTCWVVDNFYENPDEVRKFALEQEYVEGGFGRGFIGRRTEQQFLFPGLKEKFEEIMGMKITKWQEHGMNGRFQNCHSGEALVYHCDSQKWGGMLYLTPSAPYQCGTTLYANKKTRARSYHDPGWNDAWDNMPGDPHLDRTPFEPVDVVGNVYNRLMIFDASCIHSASEYFGTVMENSRLWQMFFFDTEGYESFIY